MERAKFDNEKELDSWVLENVGSFLGDGILIKGFQISTRRNKGAVPDWFFLDVTNSIWYVIETELIDHGVWNHIAEQIMRFLVAVKNDETQRDIRNVFFDEIETKGLIPELSRKLNVPPYRLMEQIETVIEGTRPHVVFFIDEVNEDMMDMCEALNSVVKVYRVQKYRVDGKTHYISPDSRKTVFETTEEQIGEPSANPIPSLDILGGGKIVDRIGNSKIYQLPDGERTFAKYSKRYKDSSYWYAIYPSASSDYEQKKIGSVIFIMGSEGFVKVPIRVLKEYLAEANVTKKEDGSIQKYHVRIRTYPEVRLTQTRTGREWLLDEYYYLQNEH